MASLPWMIAFNILLTYLGELICPGAVETDQGAYSCEAINIKGSCFAGSAGCGQPGNDFYRTLYSGKRHLGGI